MVHVMDMLLGISVNLVCVLMIIKVHVYVGEDLRHILAMHNAFVLTNKYV